MKATMGPFASQGKGIYAFRAPVRGSANKAKKLEYDLRSETFCATFKKEGIGREPRANNACVNVTIADADRNSFRAVWTKLVKISSKHSLSKSGKRLVGIRCDTQNSKNAYHVARPRKAMVTIRPNPRCIQRI